jgi:exodeoxyribonuclease-3
MIMNMFVNWFGYFNSNVIWDKKHQEGNHFTVLKLLEQKGIYSTYNEHFNEHQGDETRPTLFMYRHQDKSYHIDYFFASKDLIEALSEVKVG